MKTLIALLALSAAPLSAVADDSCAALIPPALKSQILARFSAYRLPHETDNLSEDIQYARELLLACIPGTIAHTAHCFVIGT
jgi:hypothetical protein